MGSLLTLFFDLDFICQSNSPPFQFAAERDERFLFALGPEIYLGADWKQVTQSSVHLARPLYRSSLPTM